MSLDSIEIRKTRDRTWFRDFEFTGWLGISGCSYVRLEEREPDREVEGGRSAVRADTKEVSVGEKDVTGGITRTGDEMVRTALYEAANVSRITRFSKLKRWGMDVAKRRGSKRAKVALARKIGIILHRMWIDGTTYRWAEAKPIAAQA